MNEIDEQALRVRCEDIACHVGAEASDAISVIMQFAKQEQARGLREAADMIAEDERKPLLSRLSRQSFAYNEAVKYAVDLCRSKADALEGKETAHG